MNVIFQGVRGSISVSGIEFSRYGGNTTCTEIMTDTAQIIIDAGSGFQNVALANDRPIVILLSHFHHDHIQDLASTRASFPDSLKYLFALRCVHKTLRRVTSSNIMVAHIFQ